jgi:CDP-glucose 4,6-dehydratase
MEDLVMRIADLAYYSGKKVFVTGHTGFKGGWLLACLQKAGAIVKGYALKPEFPSLFTLMQGYNNIESVIADIRDKDRIISEIHSFQPEFIFHMAAQPLVRRSYELPSYTFDVNVTGTANVLEAVVKLQEKCTIVVITTDKVYENKEERVLYKEDDTLGGYDPYSASKACTEIVTNSFRHSFFNPANFSNHRKAIATARAGNVIGGGDWSKDRIFPDIARALKQPEEINVRNPSAIRPWQFVLEPISGYLRLGRLLDTNPQNHSHPYNFGPEANDHLTVQELVQFAIKEWGKGTWKDTSLPTQPHEAGLLQLDISLAKSELDWHPKLSSRQAIKWTVQWYKKQTAERLAFSIEQVKEFFNS